MVKEQWFSITIGLGSSRSRGPGEWLSSGDIPSCIVEDRVFRGAKGARLGGQDSGSGAAASPSKQDRGAT